MPSRRYRHLRPLGTGATATVALCRDETTGSVLALKIIRRPYDESRFSSEVAINQLALCDQVIRIHGYYTTDSSFCILFEPGLCDLFSRIDDNGPLAESSAKAVLFDLLTAIARLHDRGIVHRDIKLENLILVEPGRVKLADFGLAEVLAPGAKMRSRRGFYRYWAPEVILAKPQDAKVDVWALGVCLLACLTGAFPFGGDDEYEYTTAVVWDEPDLERLDASEECVEIVR
jgi:serine/threonine protein kinase